MFTNTTSNHDLLKLLILFFLLPNKSTLAYLECDDGTGDDSCQSRAGPADKSKETFDTWFHEFNLYIESLQKDVDLAIYDDQRLAWAHTSFIQPQMMLHDKFIYDRTKNIWTVDKYLTDLNERYGGIDSVLLWQGYPNIGVDERNQFDMLASLPGGIDGLTQLVGDFHDRSVKVLLPYLPWDQGTRLSGQSDVFSLVDIITQSNCDGMNGDTLDGVNGSFWEESLLQNHAITIEPETMFSNYQYLTTNIMSWGYWTSPEPKHNLLVPPVSVYKAISKGKHLTHICERWSTIRTDGIQYAFFNGAGYESWENVWGIFNKITPRDGAALKRTSTILRYFGTFLQGGYDQWIPHIPVIASPTSKTFVSEFRSANKVIWLMVNRDKHNDEMVELRLTGLNSEDEQWFDLYHGTKLGNMEYNNFSEPFTLHVEANGYGAILVTLDDVPDQEFLTKMSDLSSIPLNEYSHIWEFLPQVMDTQPNLQVDNFTLEIHRASMIEVPGTEEDTPFQFTVDGNCIEGNELSTGIDVQFPWEEHPKRHHNHKLDIPTLLVDRYPVTNSDYKTFLLESGWTPATRQNWLNHWNDYDDYPEGYDKKPVVWVSHGDAVAYCNYYRKRLPHTWEWQWIAQGDNGWKWPWGTEKPDDSLMPIFSNGRVMPPPDDVDLHPLGASWAGIEDLVGNVYQWTDVFSDLHTSKAVLRGSPHWRPEASKDLNCQGCPNWYQPYQDEGPLREHNTFLLMSDSMDRNGQIGFRCVSETT